MFLYALYPYVKSYAVYQCPDDTTYSGSSYDFHNNICQTQVNTVDVPTVTVALIVAYYYGQTIVAQVPSSAQESEFNTSYGNGLNTDYNTNASTHRIFNTTIPILPRHGASSSIEMLFLDGHVKLSTPININATGPDGCSVPGCGGLNAVISFADPNNLPAGAVGTMCTMKNGSGFVGAVTCSNGHAFDLHNSSTATSPYYFWN